MGLMHLLKHLFLDENLVPFPIFFVGWFLFVLGTFFSSAVDAAFKIQSVDMP